MKALEWAKVYNKIGILGLVEQKLLWKIAKSNIYDLEHIKEEEFLVLVAKLIKIDIINYRISSQHFSQVISELYVILTTE